MPQRNVEKRNGSVKTSIDRCLTDIAKWYIKHSREITIPELKPILKKHYDSKAEVEEFLNFLGTVPGKRRFRAILRQELQKNPILESVGAGLEIGRAHV